MTAAVRELIGSGVLFDLKNWEKTSKLSSNDLRDAVKGLLSLKFSETQVKIQRLYTKRFLAQSFHQGINSLANIKSRFKPTLYVSQKINFPADCVTNKICLISTPQKIALGLRAIKEVKIFFPEMYLLAVYWGILKNERSKSPDLNLK
jgi:hypothetical protein